LNGRGALLIITALEDFGVRRKSWKGKSAEGIISPYDCYLDVTLRAARLSSQNGGALSVIEIECGKACIRLVLSYSTIQLVHQDRLFAIF